MRNTSRKFAVFCDFDGTVTVEEVSVSMLRKYTGDHWLKADRALMGGKITLRETMKREFGLLRTPRKELEAFVRTIKLRPGFAGFVQLCTKNKLPLTIISEGLDFYIRAFLDHHGLDVDFQTNHAVFTKNGIAVRYPHSSPECDYCGNCKKAHILKMKKMGYTTIYVGDGISDRCPGKHADMVFARSTFLDYCRKEKIPCIPYNDFTEVLAAVREIVAHERRRQVLRDDLPRSASGTLSARSGHQEKDRDGRDFDECHKNQKVRQ